MTIPTVSSVLLLTAAPLLMAGDNFSSATLLTGTNSTSTLNNLDATLEPAESALPFFTNRSVWWKWVAPSNGRVIADNVGSAAISKRLSAYISKTAATDLTTLNLIATDSNSGTASLAFPVIAGSTYYFQAGSGFASDSGALKLTLALNTNNDVNQLNIQTGLYSGNDAFADRIVLTGTQPTGFAYTYGATIESGPADALLRGRSLWWTWTAPQNGRLSIVTAGSDPSLNKRVGVFLGSELPNLTTIAFNSGDAPVSTVYVTRGQTYQIGVGNSFSSDYGNLLVTLSLNTESDLNELNLGPAATANDLFANRLTIMGGQVSSIGYGYSATTEALEPSAAGTRTLWWTYTAPGSGPVTLTTAGSGSTDGKVLAAWRGSSLASLTEVARASANVPTTTFNATAGTTYHISVGGQFSSTDLENVLLTLSGPPGPNQQPLNSLNIQPAVRLTWPTILGTTYRIQTSNNLNDWTNVGNPVLGNGQILELYRDTTPAGSFFRIVPQ